MESLASISWWDIPTLSDRVRQHSWIRTLAGDSIWLEGTDSRRLWLADFRSWRLGNFNILSSIIIFNPWEVQSLILKIQLCPYYKGRVLGEMAGSLTTLDELWFGRLPKSSRLRKSEVLAGRTLDACCFAAANKRPDPFNSESTTLAARLQDSPTACVTNTSKRTIWL